MLLVVFRSLEVKLPLGSLEFLALMAIWTKQSIDHHNLAVESVGHTVIGGQSSVSLPVAGGSRLLGVPQHQEFPEAQWEDEVSWKALLMMEG